MKKTLASGLAAVLVAGGLGFVAGPAQAESAPPVASSAALGPLPLDLCELLPELCASPVVGPLLVGLDDALVDLLGTSTTDNPELLLESVEGLVEAVVETLTGLSGPDGQAAADAIAGQLQSLGLDPAILTQVLAGLDLSGAELPDSALSDLLGTVQTTVQDLVSGLLSLGGQTPDPAQVQALVDEITAALAGGDAAALQSVLENLLTSLQGGSSLDSGTLARLVNPIVETLQGALGGSSVPQVIDDVDDALNGGNAAATATPTLSSPKGYFTNRRPAIRGTGTAGASVSVRTNTGTLLGTATVNSAGAFVVTSRKLKIGAYRVTATQVQPGRAASAQSAGRSFRVVSAKPVIQTTSKTKFKTNRPTIKGIGYPKSRIVLRSSAGKKLGSVKVRSDGTWAIKPKKLSSGKQKIKAVQTGHGKKKTTKVRTIRIR